MILKMNRMFLWRGKSFAGVKPGTPEFVELHKAANFSPVALARLCCRYDQGGLALLDVESHFVALRVSYVLRLFDPRHTPWKRLLRDSICTATNGWVRDEFLFLSS